jgi:hypothetical protein
MTGWLMPKILLLDIETFPNVAHVWRFYKENVGAKQVVEHSTIASFAYKWLGEDGVFYYDTQHQSEKKLLKELVNVLDAADIVIAHNGNKFDLPTIQGRAMVAGLKPPSPYKTIDTLLVSKYEFNFPANSLEYLAIILGCSVKGGHKKFPGFELWEQCMKNNPEAWEEMRIYNIQDVRTLEEVYLKMRPYMKRHPNVAVFAEADRPLCPKCGSGDIQLRGFVTTNVYKYRKYRCNSCGGWSRTRFNVLDTSITKNTLVNTN